MTETHIIKNLAVIYNLSFIQSSFFSLNIFIDVMLTVIIITSNPIH
jgi:hypothetical protein